MNTSNYIDQATILCVFSVIPVSFVGPKLADLFLMGPENVPNVLHLSTNAPLLYAARAQRTHFRAPQK